MDKERITMYFGAQKRLEGVIIALEMADDDSTCARLIDVLEDANVALKVLLNWCDRAKEDEEKGG